MINRISDWQGRFFGDNNAPAVKKILAYITLRGRMKVGEGVIVNKVGNCGLVWIILIDVRAVYFEDPNELTLR